MLHAELSDDLSKALGKKKWRQQSPGNWIRQIIVKSPRGEITVFEFKTSCMDCGDRDPQFFMVEDAVWREAGFTNPDDGIVCIWCFKKRLARPLKRCDFTFHPMNDLIFAVNRLNRKRV